MRGLCLVRALKQDMKRAFWSWQFLLSILLGAAVCYFTLQFCENYRSTTVHKFVLLHDRSQSFLAYIVGILPFALCLYDDFANRNIQNMLGRISLPVYMFSKTCAAISSTILSFVLGKLLFVFVYSLSSPICLPETLNIIPTSILYMSMLENNNYNAFFIMSSLQKALYCAILCQMVMLVSILIPNKAVVFSLPIVVFYVLNFYVNNHINAEYLNFTYIFDGVTRLLEKDSHNFIYASLIALISYCFLYYITLSIMRKKVYRE